MRGEDLIQRTATVVGTGSEPERGGRLPATGTQAGQDHLPVGSLLEDVRKWPAIVLLAPPGMGKTTAFRAAAHASDGHFVTARDFLTLGAPRDTTLFIDGLDEVRAGGGDPRLPLDEVRRKLKELGKPSFRLSCREADWLGSDRDKLAMVAPGGRLTVLRLDPLDDGGIERFVKHHCPRTKNAPSLEEWEGARSLLGNPQILQLLLSAAGEVGSSLPKTKTEIFEGAVKRLVEEDNPEHRDAVRGDGITKAQRRQAAELLCTLMMVADEPWLALNGDGQSPPALRDIDEAKTGGVSLKCLEAAARSKLFMVEDGRVGCIHRSVAEYLCACHLRDRLDSVSAERILALLTGFDGQPLKALRGVLAWLTTLARKREHREMLLARDPFGVALYGDLAQFSANEKCQYLGHLGGALEAMPVLEFSEAARQGLSFANLRGSATDPLLRDILEADDLGLGQQRLVFFLLSSMVAGDRQYFGTILTKIARDASRYSFVRESALSALMTLAKADGHVQPLLDLLKDIYEGQVEDWRDDMLGQLLRWLYPQTLAAEAVLDYLRQPKAPGRSGSYSWFWSVYLPRQTEDAEVPKLLDAFAERGEFLDSIENHSVFSGIAGLLARGLGTAGENVKASRLAAWLGLGIEAHGRSRIYRNEGQLEKIRVWLAGHPQAWQGVLEHGVRDSVAAKLTEERRHLGLQAVPEYAVQETAAVEMGGEQCHRKLQLKIDALQSAIPPVELAGFCWELACQHKATPVAEWLCHKALALGRDDEDLKARVTGAAAGDPLIKGWLTRWEDHRRSIEAAAQAHEENWRAQEEKRAAEKEGFIRDVRDNIDSFRDGRAKVGAYGQIGMGYFERFIDFRGSTGRERLQCFFEDEALVEDLLTGLRQFLVRQAFPASDEKLGEAAKGSAGRRPIPAGETVSADDEKHEKAVKGMADRRLIPAGGAFPTSDEVFKKVAKGLVDPRSFALLAGVCEFAKDDPKKVTELDEALLEAVVAVCLTALEATAESWYSELLAGKPELFARVAGRYIAQCVRLDKDCTWLGSALAFDQRYAAVAKQLAVPALRRLPLRLTGWGATLLSHLLCAACHHDRQSLLPLIEEKLGSKSLPAGLRIRWLTMAALLAPQHHRQGLELTVAGDVKRMEHVFAIVIPWWRQGQDRNRVSTATIAMLIGLIGRTYPYVSPLGDHELVSTYTREVEASDLIRSLLDVLAARPDPEAGDCLAELLNGAIANDRGRGVSDSSGKGSAALHPESSHRPAERPTGAIAADPAGDRGEHPGSC